MWQRFVIVVICLFGVLTTQTWAQKIASSKQPISMQRVDSNQLRDKEDPALTRLSADYQLDAIEFGETGVPIYLNGDLTPRFGGGEPVQSSYAFFEENMELFYMSNPRADLSLVTSERDAIGMTHVSFRQTYQSIPVFFGELKTHFSTNGRLRTVNGEYFPGINISTRANLSAQSAMDAVLSDLRVSAKEISVRETPALWILPHNHEYYLTWHVIVDGPGYDAWRYFIDAQYGNVVNRIPLVMPEQPVENSTAPARQVSDTERLRELSTRPLEAANAEVFFGREGTWFRREGDYDFGPAFIVDDVAAFTAREHEAQARNAGSDWRDFVLDLRDPEALQQAQSRRLALTALPEAGYYRIYTSKQVINELGQLGIDAAVYPDLPGPRPMQPNNDVKPRQRENTLDDILFSETFEGIWPSTGWQVGDEEATNGFDYWDDISCQFHGGGWSGWCADEGDMTDCVNYDDYMTSYMTTPAVDIYGRSSLHFQYWWRNSCESNYDYFRVYVQLDNGGWVLLQEHTGSSPTWQLYGINITIAGGGQNLYFKFVFSSDYSVHSQEGAYVDDIQVSGVWANCGYMGIGTGMMGDWRDHIDASWSFADGVYHLEDKTRCQSTGDCQHTHSGQMRNDQSIISWDASNGTHFTDDNNGWNEPVGIDAHYFTTVFYDFLLNQLGRNSYDGNGAGLYGIVDDPTCTNNAYGGGATIRYCAPAGNWRSTAGCPDVIAHEWGHSLTNNESGLAYQRESGGLNEGFSDILGAAFGFVSGLDADWLMGENIFTNGGAFRDMANPPAYWQPECYLGEHWYACDPTSCPTPNNNNDQCGVHTNSGVPNRMFSLLSDGGTENGVTVNGIGVLNALRVVYRANCEYWTSGTNMAAARTGCISAAQDLNASWVTEVTNAWAAVCVGTSVETPLDCSNPIPLQNGVPYTGTTADGAGHVISYNCSAWNERGPEKVHTINIAQTSTIVVSLSGMTTDLDVFLLNSCDDDACLAYGNSSLLYNNAFGTYYVVVDGYNGAVGPYTIELCILPGTATLVSPADGATACTSQSVTFDWNDVTAADGYTWQFDDNSDFSSPLSTQTVTTSSYTGNFLLSGTRYWRVKANGAGTCDDGSWSAVRTLTLSTTPGGTTISYPSWGTTVCSGVARSYAWRAVAGATLYRVQWDDNNQYTSPLELTTTDTTCTQTIVGEWAWYWRVRAENSCGLGAWSTLGGVSLLTVPAAVPLTAPADGGTVCVNTSTTFDWTGVNHAWEYIIQWDEDVNFGSPVTQTVTSSDANYTFTTAGTYYWRVRGENWCFDGLWSAVRSVVATVIPAQAVANTPAEGASICSGATQAYSWTAQANAVNYTIQWDDNSSFASPVEQTVTAATASQALTGTGLWYWRVRANNACGSGMWAATRTFTLTTVPGTTTQSNPAAGAQVCTNTVTAFTWTAVVGALNYTIQWDDDASFGSPVEQTTPNLIYNQSFSTPGTQNWRVRANNACGNGTWTAGRSLVVITAPGQVVLSAPVEGASFCSGSSQTYSWTAQANAVDYLVQWADNSSFNSPTQQTVSTTSATQALTGTGTRYWRARANNSCGSGTWSATRTVTLLGAPAQATLAAPAEGAVVCSGVTQSFSWNAVTGATGYTVQWDDNSGFTSPVEQTIAGTSANQSLTGTGTWYWRARANGSCGFGSWSTTRSFALSAGPGTPTLVAPLNGVSFCSGVVQSFSWNPVPGATGYVIQWDDNSGFSSPVQQTVTSTNAAQALTGAGMWYWRVSAQNACGSGSWSGSRTFFLSAGPAQAVLLTPADGSALFSGAVYSYCWETVLGAASYTIQWADNTGFASPIQASTTSTCYDQTLTGTGTRYWRVRAEGDCGAGAWSILQDVVLVEPQPPTVVIWMDSDSLRLSWTPVLNADSYLIEAGSTPNGSYSPLTVQPDTTHGMALPLPTPVRFFRVRSQFDTTP